jgi:hypothetical protein
MLTFYPKIRITFGKPTPCIGGQDPFAKQDPIGTYATFCANFTEDSGTD